MTADLPHYSLFMLFVVLLCGCNTNEPHAPPQASVMGAAPASRVVMADSPRINTFNVDSGDYNAIAKQLYDSLTSNRRLRQGAVVALGPVIYNLEDGVKFDHRTLGEKIQTHALKAGLLNFTFGIDAHHGSADGMGSVAKERMKIMRLSYEQSATVDQEDLMTYGQMARVDYMLFGRCTSMTAIQDGYRETTYTFNWKLGDCRTGLFVWVDEMEYTKRTR